MGDRRVTQRIPGAVVTIGSCYECEFRKLVYSKKDGLRSYCTKNPRHVILSEQQELEQLPAWCPLPKT